MIFIALSFRTVGSSSGSEVSLFDSTFSAAAPDCPTQKDPAAITMNALGRNFEKTNFIFTWLTTLASLRPYKKVEHQRVVPVLAGKWIPRFCPLSLTALPSSYPSIGKGVNRAHEPMAFPVIARNLLLAGCP